ncbi:P-loop containing nucleoside triphosphate hydrolase protein [Kalaharituber pfeilii]|nr:P-loop containing nucleoside triphosphate hydrolase protein [Kalaharituber pfeilii]
MSTENSESTPKNMSSSLQEWEQTREYYDKERLLRCLTKDRTLFDPKPAQLRFAMCLFFGHDVSCVAATGFGKSLAFQMTTFLLEKRNRSRPKNKQFGVIITPIEALGEDQVTQCAKLGIPAISLTDSVMHSNPKVIEDIMNGEFLLVYLAPERLMEKDSPLQKLIKYQRVKIKERIAFVVVDECHLVEDWGNDFRTDFSKLDTFRYKIPGVPFGMCTATATPEKLKRIRKGLGIQKTAISIVEPINRTNLFFAAREIRGGGDIEGAGDLDFLIPPCKDQGREYDQREIPPTIIYVDDKLLAHKIVQHLQSLLPPITNNRPEPENRWDFDPRSRAEKIVTVYHATLSAVMKEYTQADWRAGVTRILVATSAWGMGINDKHVHRVIQWKAKDMNNLDTLIQRFGRCARDSTIQGFCLLFYEKDCFGDRLISPTPRKRTADGEPKERRTPAEIRGTMETGLYRFINTPGTIKCRRKIILGHYADQQYNDETLYNGICCDLCGTDHIDRLAPEVFDTVVLFRPPNSRSTSKYPTTPNELQLSLRSILSSLRKEILHKEYPKSRLHVDSWIMSTEQIHILATKCRGIHSPADLFKIPGLTFDRMFRKYGNYSSYIRNGNITNSYQASLIFTQIHHHIQSYYAVHESQPPLSQTNTSQPSQPLSVAAEVQTALIASIAEHPANISATSSMVTDPSNNVLPAWKQLSDMYSRETVITLKTLLRTRKLPVSGLKPVLVDRLIQFDLAQFLPPVTASSTSAAVDSITLQDLTNIPQPPRRRLPPQCQSKQHSSVPQTPRRRQRDNSVQATPTQENLENSPPTPRWRPVLVPGANFSPAPMTPSRSRRY